MSGCSRKKLDLTGLNFGRMTVLGPADNINGRTAWRCVCSCGKEVLVKTCHLRSGHVKSCGCLRAESIKQRLNYIDGTCVELLRSGTMRRNNSSGVPGVDWWAAKGKWRATICFKGKRTYLGSYQRFEDAVAARRKAEENLHGKFLREFAASSAPQKESS